MPFTLETPRLILREKVVADAPFFMELNADPEVTRYTGDTAFRNPGEAEAIVRYVMSQYQRYGYGRWLVSLKSSGEPLGWCGLKYHDDSGDTDLGYRFLQKHWGQGYATEAAQACLAYGFIQLGLARIIGRADAANTASVQVLKKLGMTFFKEEILYGRPAYIYHILNHRTIYDAHHRASPAY